MSICTNHSTNQNKVRKTVPTTIPTMFKRWRNSKEKSQAHNLKVVSSNPAPRNQKRTQISIQERLNPLELGLFLSMP